jgi:hypothetical protein
MNMVAQHVVDIHGYPVIANDVVRLLLNGHLRICAVVKRNERLALYYSGGVYTQYGRIAAGTYEFITDTDALEIVGHIY